MTSFSYSMQWSPVRLGIRDVERFLRQEGRCVVGGCCRARKEEAPRGVCPVLGTQRGSDVLDGVLTGGVTCCQDGCICGVCAVWLLLPGELLPRPELNELHLDPS